MPTSTNSPTPLPFRQCREYRDIQRALAQLPNGSVPLANAVQAIEKVADDRDRSIRIIGLVQEALAQLRVDIKYLHFDLDATRKERDEYKRRLEES